MAKSKLYRRIGRLRDKRFKEMLVLKRGPYAYSIKVRILNGQINDLNLLLNE